MITSLTSQCTSITVLAVVAYLVKRHLNRKSFHPLPPGPKGLPIIGNAADFPTQEQWKAFAKWGEEYGDLIYLNVLGQPIVIANSAEHAYEMLDKKSALYSDRPTLWMGGELVGWSRSLGMMRFGETFKTVRKMLYKAIGTKAHLEQYVAMEELETQRMLKRILETPDDLVDGIRKTAGAIILNISYGYSIKENDDPLVNIADDAMDKFSLMTQPGSFVVDSLPFLRFVPAWFPGATFKRKAARWRRTLDDLHDVPHAFVKDQMRKGTHIQNFTSQYLEENPTPEEEEMIKVSAGSLYAGGSDTTVSATNTFYLAMTLYPNVQAKAQEEIDRVIGTDRLPCLSDRDQLPYMNAILKEVCRWNPVAPLGVPHRLMKDDIHAGYYIPEGTIIMPNVWKMLHEPSVYAEPMEFNPGRFLGSNPERDPTELCFGFGRRVCPGKVLAESSVWLACAMSLAAFDIRPYVDPTSGQEVLPEPVMQSGTISHPKPFRCSIKPRSKAMEALIQSVKSSE